MKNQKHIGMGDQEFLCRMELLDERSPPKAGVDNTAGKEKRIGEERVKQLE